MVMRFEVFVAMLMKNWVFHRSNNFTAISSCLYSHCVLHYNTDALRCLHSCKLVCLLALI